MILVIKKEHENRDIEKLSLWFKEKSLDTQVVNLNGATVMVVSGDCSSIDIDAVRSFRAVDSVTRIQKPYKLASRKFKSQDTVIDVNGVKIGGDSFTVIAGPCSIENEKQIIDIAFKVKQAGAKLLRGGAFKPRTSPYTFQGLGEKAISYLVKAKKETGLPIVSEIMNINHIDMFSDVDILQIGARDMQNFELLKQVGKTKKPILLKRGFCNTIEEWLMSAEYLMSEGANDVILCERGIRTFEASTRNTLDLSCVPLLKELTHLPIIVDPSHATGISRFVKPLSLASVGAGADGLIIEVHDNPESAFSDGAQAIRPNELNTIITDIKKILDVCGKNNA